MDNKFCCIVSQSALPWKHDADPLCWAFQRCLKQWIEFVHRVFHVNSFCLTISKNTLYIAELLVEMKRTRPFYLEFLAPYEEMTNRWNSNDRDRFFALMEQCDCSGFLQAHYDPHCYSRCECGLRRKSRYVIALWDGSRNQRIQSVLNGMEQKKIFLVDPFSPSPPSQLRVLK